MIIGLLVGAAGLFATLVMGLGRVAGRLDAQMDRDEARARAKAAASYHSSTGSSPARTTVGTMRLAVTRRLVASSRPIEHARSTRGSGSATPDRAISQSRAKA
jgi:hypothetical protein